MPRPRLAPLALAAATALAGAPSARATYNFYQTCNPPPGSACGSVAIPDFPGAPAELTLAIPNDPSGNYIVDVSVSLWIQHTYQGDLRVELVSPAGTVVTLIDRPGGGGFSANDFGGFTHDDSTIYFGPLILSDYAFPNNFTYDAPQVAFPGIDFSSTPFGFPCLTCRTYLPDSPLTALRGESKVGTWRLRVTDLAALDVGNIRYLGLGIQSCGISAPHANISAPTAFAACCNPTVITGTAEAPLCGLAGYVVEHSASPQGPWTLIASVGPTPVVNGTLATWNTLGVPEGYRFVRLTVADDMFVTNSFTTVVYVDQLFNGIDIRKPLNNAILGGVVCPDGTISDYSFDSYMVEYAAPPCTAFSAVEPGTPIFTSPVVNDPLAHWNTRSGGAAVADGNYCIRFTGLDSCSHIATVTRNITIDNTPPVAFITSPLSCTNVRGIVTITGTVTDAHLAGWVVQVMGAGSHTWTNIGSGSGPVIGGTLATWNTSGLSPCPYAIRLIASDAALVDCERGNNSTEYGIVVNVGCPADFNRDGAVNSQDYFDFLNAYFAGC